MVRLVDHIGLFNQLHWVIGSKNTAQNQKYYLLLAKIGQLYYKVEKMPTLHYGMIGKEVGHLRHIIHLDYQIGCRNLIED